MRIALWTPFAVAGWSAAVGRTCSPCASATCRPAPEASLATPGGTSLTYPASPSYGFGAEVVASRCLAAKLTGSVSRRPASGRRMATVAARAR